MRLASAAAAAIAVTAVAAAGWRSPAVSMATDDPNIAPAIQTTCSYDQVVAALRVADPNAAGLLDEYPQAQSWLRDFLALPPDQRQQRLESNPRWQQNRNSQTAQQFSQTLTQVANTCHNY